MAVVLVVDDEKGIRVTLSAFLQEDGHTVEAAPDVQEAERLLAQKEFDVVVSDVILPGLTGLELLRRIKSVAPSTLVVLMTGEPTLETATEALRAGASDYLSKPFSKGAIKRAVSHAARIRSLNEQKRRLEEENRRYQEKLEQLVAERTKTLEKREAQLSVVIKRLERMMTGSIEAISTVIERRDPYTAGHERRVAALACTIAKDLGCAEHQMRGIQVAAFVHDIGKIALPAEILSKPSKLNDLEYSLVKAHPQVGFDILRKIEFVWPVAEATLQHHERLDGSGYPQGLKGGEALLEARILAVGDVVEAMVSHRPYRAALGLEKALAEISDKKGILYDPDVVDACLRAFLEEAFSFDTAGE
jgi:response regulator RpfG family c-di-GMP phosphodiesterase